eukprot:Skav210730  [mRNA]  locus=scaffold849:381322:383939:- [translate_table: standard]
MKALTVWDRDMWQEVDERNAKLLQTLSEATDMLAKADEMQELSEARKATEEAIAKEAAAADAVRDAEAPTARQRGAEGADLGMDPGTKAPPRVEDTTAEFNEKLQVS